MVTVKRKEGESTSALLRRFSKKVYQSGILKEAKKKQFKTRKPSLRAKKLSALYKLKKQEEIKKARKLGKI
jgi:ribosomal protein S21